MRKSNCIIIGAGIIGCTIARELLKRGYDDILILEKESEIASHASGRNSGVLHAGVYYPPNSMKARYCLRGNQLMKEYCREHGLPLLETGKVIVTRDEVELPKLMELYERATSNGAKIDVIDEKTLAEIEPHARTTQKALYSHYTAMVDPKKIMNQLHDELVATKKVNFEFSSRFVNKIGNNCIQANRDKIEYNLFINAAGSYADKIAHAFGIGRNLTLIPFKGIYHKLKPEFGHLVNGNIYPVPNLNNPFLGVHFTKSINGTVYLGPTAIPAFGRENYGIFQGVDKEALSILYKEMILFFQNREFRQVSLIEPRKYVKKWFFNEARELVSDLHKDWMMPTNKVGIRPQLIDWKSKKLIMDFLIKNDENSIHILNSISPAFTSSMAFAKFIVDQYIETRK